MADLGSVVGTVTSGGGDILTILIWGAIIVFGLFILIAVFGWLWWSKKRYNLRVEIKLTRSDSRIVNGEWGKGFYDSKKGVVMIKRPGARPIPMKIFDPRRYMQGQDLLTVIQIGPEDYRPVLNDSWQYHVLEKDTGKQKLDGEGRAMFDKDGKPVMEKEVFREAILNIKTETGENKAWRAAWEEAAKNAYSITNFLKQFQTPIAIGIVVICCFIGFAILWTKIPSI